MRIGTPYTPAPARRIAKQRTLQCPDQRPDRALSLRFAARPQHPKGPNDKTRLGKVAVMASIRLRHALSGPPGKLEAESDIFRLAGKTMTLTGQLNDPVIGKAVREGRLTEERWKTGDDIELYGWFAKPRGTKPTVIVASGYGGGLSKTKPYLKSFIQEGYGCLAFDYRGHGQSESASVSKAAMIQDACSAIKHVQEKGIPTEQMILQGISLGSPVILGARSQDAFRNKRFKLISLSAPIAGDEMADYFRKISRVNRLIFPPGKRIIGTYEAWDYLQAVREPLLILQGGKDAMVKKDVAPKYLSLVPDQHSAYLAPLPDQGHNIQSDMLVKQVDAFLEAQCAEPPIQQP
jgi:pimeloyl-ACP methyl ester carboxylesterase